MLPCQETESDETGRVGIGVEDEADFKKAGQPLESKPLARRLIDPLDKSSPDLGRAALETRVVFDVFNRADSKRRPSTRADEVDLKGGPCWWARESAGSFHCAEFQVEGIRFPAEAWLDDHDQHDAERAQPRKDRLSDAGDELCYR